MQPPAGQVSGPDTTRSLNKKRKLQYITATLTVFFTIALTVIIVINWSVVEEMAGYGYAGGFIISALGGATVIIPVPMLAVQFALGGILQPLFGPQILGPLHVGIVCSIGETLGALSIYLIGIGGSAPFTGRKSGWVIRISEKVNYLLERRGQITLFLLSAIMNPFFYPASLAMGASRFGVKRYMLITFAGKCVKCTTITYAGYFGLKGLFRAIGIEV